ncbi:hypothetical protein ANN_10008 [Periplaneta americana]|uniref:Uncharacterized protein n=1 Tax=Periplaneta americana TaxID=6978 RepID=A0ABQ8TNX0_PERAM|nr:hypothetical protein ANN_10008 [Periplaneta americana]
MYCRCEASCELVRFDFSSSVAQMALIVVLMAISLSNFLITVDGKPAVPSQVMSNKIKTPGRVIMAAITLPGRIIMDAVKLPGRIINRTKELGDGIHYIIETPGRIIRKVIQIPGHIVQGAIKLPVRIALDAIKLPVHIVRGAIQLPGRIIQRGGDVIRRAVEIPINITRRTVTTPARFVREVMSNIRNMIQKGQKTAAMRVQKVFNRLSSLTDVLINVGSKRAERKEKRLENVIDGITAHLNAIDLARDRTRNLGHRRPALYRLANQVNYCGEEYADIVYDYGLCDGSSLRAVAEYERHFRNRRVPYR